MKRYLTMILFAASMQSLHAADNVVNSQAFEINPHLDIEHKRYLNVTVSPQPSDQLAVYLHYTTDGPEDGFSVEWYGYEHDPFEDGAYYENLGIATITESTSGNYADNSFLQQLSSHQQYVEVVIHPTISGELAGDIYVFLQTMKQKDLNPDSHMTSIWAAAIAGMMLALLLLYKLINTK